MGRPTGSKNLRPSRIPVRRPAIFPVGPSIAYIPLTQGKFSLVDADDAPKLALMNWSAYTAKTRNTVYAIRGRMKTQQRMHSAICPVPSGKMVDHRNGNGLDNRKCNLRPADRFQNSQNRRNVKLGSSFVQGVSLHKPSGKWLARINVQGVRISLGHFSSLEDAIVARETAVKTHYREFSPQK